MVKTQFFFGGKEVTLYGYSEDDWIFKTIDMHKTFYEIDLLRYMQFALKDRSGTIIDVGANIGNHSVFFHLVMGNRVISFEPNPPIFEILKKNIETNHIEAEIYQMGLGEKCAHYIVKEDHAEAKDNIGAAKLAEDKKGSILVEALDDVLSPDILKQKNLIALKADIEGMEIQMLRGALKILKQLQPDLFLEISEASLMIEIEALLYPLGYKRLYAYAGTPVWHFTHQANLGYRRTMALWMYHKYIQIQHTIGKFLRFIQKRITQE